MRTLRDDRGAMLIYLSASIVTMVLFIGVGINSGWLVFVRNRAQAAVDASTLAAAAAIPDHNKGGNKIETLLTAFNTQNTVMDQSASLQMSNVTFLTYPPDSGDNPPPNAILVQKSFSVPVFLWRLFGDEFKTVSVRSTAALLPPGGLKPELPVALMDCQVGYPGLCQVSRELTGFNGSPSPDDDSGFTSFFIHNASADEFKDLVQNPSNIPFVNIGDFIELSNGAVDSVLNEIDKKFKTVAHPWCVIIPIISCTDLNSGNANQLASIVGFAQICITAVKKQGNPKSITAYLDCNVAASGTPGFGQKFGLFVNYPVLVNQ